ncbi:MAG: hypothetical protein ACOZDD_16860 [Bacteroidota bacterium]
MGFIKNIDSAQLNQILSGASQRIILALPGIFVKTANEIIKKYQAGFSNIKVIINCSENIIRQGYGEISAIDELKKAGVPIYNQPDNLVSFVVVDNQGYFLFPQSRIFLEESHHVNNAIPMDPFSLEQLIGIFFPPVKGDEKQFEDKLSNALILSSERIKDTGAILKESAKLKVKPLDEKTYNPVKTAIQANPPTHPDLKRELEYYTTNFLWIELKFKGANISTKTISIPKHVLPINSEDLRRKISSQLKLFENIESTTWYFKLKSISNEVNLLRKKYLNPIKAKDGKNIAKKSNLSKFREEIESIQEKILSTTNEVEKRISDEITKTKDRFTIVLSEHFKKNPTEELKNTPSKDRNRVREDFVNYLVSNIQFPEANELLSSFSLSFQEFELTEQDLNNEKLIEELKEKGILKDKSNEKLGSFGKAYHQTSLFD